MEKNIFQKFVFHFKFHNILMQPIIAPSGALVFILVQYISSKFNITDDEFTRNAEKWDLMKSFCLNSIQTNKVSILQFPFLCSTIYIWDPIKTDIFWHNNESRVKTALRRFCYHLFNVTSLIFGYIHLVLIKFYLWL